MPNRITVKRPNLFREDELFSIPEELDKPAAGAMAVRRAHFALSVADIDALYKHAKENHLRIFFDLVQARDVPLRTFGLYDPDNNIVQIFGK